MSLSTKPWQFYATFIPARALTEFLLCGMIAFTAAANWFYVKRPRVMGLVAMATPLGSAALSLVYQFFITHYGWRSAFMALGVALWVFGFRFDLLPASGAWVVTLRIAAKPSPPTARAGKRRNKLPSKL